MLLDAAQAKELVPFMDTTRLLAAAYNKRDGHLNPFHTTLAFINAFKRLGGKIHDNTAVTGGGVSIGSTSTFTMSGNAIIERNRALNGGGVQVDEEGTFNMQGGTILNNRMQPAPSTDAINNGGGVRVIGDNATFTMTGGTIGHTNPALGNAAVNGGGVWLGESASFNLSGNDAKTIIENRATYGGGVWVSEDAEMRITAGATDVNITNNTAVNDGGGVFTEDLSYTNPADTARYMNITLVGATFSGNTAGNHFMPPSNAADFNARFQGTRLNNFDINYRRPDIPPTGIDVSSTGDFVLVTLMVVVSTALFVAIGKVKHRGSNTAV